MRKVKKILIALDFDPTAKIIAEKGFLLAKSIGAEVILMHVVVDIIVMGLHSKKWLENILLGSVTEKVLHDATIPLLIIPTKKHA